MKFLILTVYFTMMMLLIFCIQKASSIKTALSKAVILLLSVAMVTILSNNIFMLSQNHFISIISQSISYICFDWLVIALLNYTEHYTNMFKGNLQGRLIVCGIAAIDTISFLINPFTHHIFDLERVDLINNLVMWSVTDTTILYYLHLVFAYFIVFLCVISFLLKLRKTPAFYNKKYLTIFGFLMAVIILRIATLFTTIVIDVSLLLYAIYAILICYYSLFYKSTGLIESTLSMVVSDMSDAVFCFDYWNNCIYANEKALRIVSQKDSEKIFNNWISEHNKDNKTSFEWDQTLTLDEEEFYLHVLYHKLYDKKRAYIGCFIIISDRTRETEKFNASIYDTTHDKLTRLYNRSYFFESVDKKIQENLDKTFIMICSNIRGFKLYNDLFGINKGDDVLRTQARLMSQHLPEDAVMGRIAGDEFAILLEQDIFNEQNFLKIINLMKQKFDTNIYTFHLYLGIYEITNTKEPVSIMCDKCKIAIETFKNDYDTIFSYYDRNLLEKSLYERKIVGELEQALENKEFKMFLQPQYSKHGNILGAEALVRWKHPIRGYISPADFVEIFEKTGVIYKLDHYMWETAAAKLKEWKDMGFDNLYISVNISGEDFKHLNVYDELTSLVTKYEIDPKTMKLEITETVLMTKMSNQLKLIEQLRAFGFLVEIDDFGSGYSSLNMLKDITVDVVKIDMEFLRNTKPEQKEKSELILNYIIGMLNKLNISVITEGVETKENVDALIRMGCDVFQGFYFSKPLEAEDFEKLLY